MSTIRERFEKLIEYDDDAGFRIIDPVKALELADELDRESAAQKELPSGPGLRMLDDEIARRIQTQNDQSGPVHPGHCPPQIRTQVAVDMHYEMVATALASLSPDKRTDVMAPWCRGCGGPTPCYCECDE